MNRLENISIKNIDCSLKITAIIKTLYFKHLQKISIDMNSITLILVEN